MKPCITVLIPTLNAEPFLEVALSSLYAQTVTDFKILVLDGGSTDNTRKIAISHDRVEFIQCGAIGLGAQLNVGLAKADTSLIARMDADDVSLPGRFEAQLSAFKDSNVAIVGTQIELAVASTICRGQPLPQSHKAIRKELLAGFPAFCHPSVMFRRDLARRQRGYAISGLGEDLDFFLRMTEAGRGLNLPNVLYRYRLHERSASHTSMDEIRRNYAYALVCAQARRDRLPEPTAASHAKIWRDRPWITRLATKVDSFASRLYRESRMRIAGGRLITGGIGAAISVALRPNLVKVRTRIALRRFAGLEERG
jgi:glycosyltransferase involved in cell wall biosynthesis